jgi:hypothetical protein
MFYFHQKYSLALKSFKKLRHRSVDNEILSLENLQQT